MLKRGSAEKGLFGGLVTGECAPSPVCPKDWWNLKPLALCFPHVIGSHQLLPSMTAKPQCKPGSQV